MDQYDVLMIVFVRWLADDVNNFSIWKKYISNTIIRPAIMSQKGELRMPQIYDKEC